MFVSRRPKNVVCSSEGELTSKVSGYGRIIPIIGFPIQNFCVYNIKFCPRRFDSVVKDKIEHVHLPPPSEIDWKQKAEEFWVN
ncbi:hypothetical protein J6590_079976 [Homalodisca vitripennis]|nr:hypothetical protein J6590_079976 [Homalodisca vitripennis]